jgi:hypothetical protein
MVFSSGIVGCAVGLSWTWWTSGANMGSLSALGDRNRNAT